jgi:hypothetical protein
MSSIIDTISSMSSTGAREYLKVNGYDEGSIADTMAEWEEFQNKPAPIPAPTPVTTKYKNTNSQLNTDNDDE